MGISKSVTFRGGEYRGCVLLLLCVLAFLAGNAHLIAAGPGPAQMMQQLARLYAASGDYSKAQSFAERALSLAEKNQNRKTLTGLCLLDLAYYSKEQGQLRSAESLCGRALDVIETSDAPETILVAAALRILSDIHRRRGDVDQAFYFLIKGIGLISACDHLPEHCIAPYMIDLAELLAMRGNVEHGHLVFSQAMEQIHKSFGPGHFYTISILARGPYLDQ